MKKKNLPIIPIIVLVMLSVVLFGVVLVRSAAVKIAPLDKTTALSEEPVEAQQPEPEPEAEPEVPPIVLGGKEIDPLTAELVLQGTETARELSDVISQLTALTAVDTRPCAFSNEEKRELLTAWPDVEFLWDVNLGDLVFTSTETALTIPQPEAAAEYAAIADLLPNISEIELAGGNYTPEQAGTLAYAWPEAHLAGTIALFRQTFSTDAEELDFSGTKISLEQTEQFKPLIAAMPQLKKVIMSDCGISNEDMDALDLSYENVRFVWTVHFKVYDVRTDTDRFCVSDLPWNKYVAWPMTDKDFAPIKYCRDLVALDLGHENISDLSFLYNMPKLKWLIIAIEHNIFDLTPVASLKDLYYLEVFNNELLDISPIAECKNLKHLNISNTRGNFSIEPLFEMKQLDRLWFALNHLTEEEKEALVAALPNTEVYLEQTYAVAGSWRTTEVYQELHAALFAPGH